MAENTIIVKDFLVKETIDFLDRKYIVTPRANRAFQGQLKKQGDTVAVKTFPRIALTTGGTAGDDINATTFAVTSENLKVEQVGQARVKVKDWEELRSDIELQSRVAQELAYDLAKKYDGHIVKVALAGAGNSVNTAALTKSNIYAEINKMRVKLSEDDAMDEAALFMSPAVISLCRQAPERDGFVEGAMVRENGSYAATRAGFRIFETNNEELGLYMLAMDKNSVHFVEQMMDMKITDEPHAFAKNVLLETLFQAKVFTTNANRICKHVYTLG